MNVLVHYQSHIIVPYVVSLLKFSRMQCIFVQFYSVSISVSAGVSLDERQTSLSCAG